MNQSYRASTLHVCVCVAEGIKDCSLGVGMAELVWLTEKQQGGGPWSSSGVL